MLYELRTYTCKQGTVTDVAKAAGTVAQDIRKNDYGKLEGYWITDIGALNQVMHLWSYKDLNERAEMRAALSKHPRWTSDYLPVIYPNIVRQETRLLHAVVGPKTPATMPNLYELRTYRARAGMARPWLELFTKALEVREKYSKLTALWTGDVGQPNEILHLWAYPDLNARNAARANAAQDPGWQAFLKNSAGMLDEMHSTIMLPAAHSPLK
jgi:NIPSNAP